MALWHSAIDSGLYRPLCLSLSSSFVALDSLSKLVEIQLVQTLDGSANVIHHVVDTNTQRPVGCSGEMNQQSGTLGGQLMAQLVGLERLVLSNGGADNLRLSLGRERDLHVTGLADVANVGCSSSRTLILTV